MNLGHEYLNHSEYPQVALDKNGNAISLWQQNDGIRWNIWANRFIVGSGWGVAQLIETEADLDWEQLAECKTIGVTAGASTPGSSGTWFLSSARAWQPLFSIF